MGYRDTAEVSATFEPRASIGNNLDAKRNDRVQEDPQHTRFGIIEVSKQCAKIPSAYKTNNLDHGICPAENIIDNVKRRKGKMLSEKDQYLEYIKNLQ